METETETMNSTQKQPEFYRKIQKLGSNTTSSTYLVKCKSDESLAVLKKYKKRLNLAHSEFKQIRNEVDSLIYLNHVNITKYHESFKNKKGDLIIVSEYYEESTSLQAQIDA